MTGRSLLLTVLLCVSPLGAQADELQDAMAAMELEDYSKAMTLLLPLAEQGNAMAQNAIGQIHANGWGVEPNCPEAMKWYQSAAEQGLAEAQFHLANNYSAECRNPQYACELDSACEQAEKWNRLAAEQGLASAQAALGFSYRSGSGVAMDFEKALYWFEQAAVQRNGWAQSGLGMMLANGEGVSRNDVAAYAWLTLATQNGYRRAQENLKTVQKRLTRKKIKQADELARRLRQDIEARSH